ncbi:MAG: hypothetical protein M5U08_04560 [Burkholderiales bacterium]|nr:hypothetical protein [Burkholderiales bacterium]
MTIEAATPMPAALIASRMPASELLAGSIVTVFVPAPFAENAAPVYLPPAPVAAS